MRHLFVTACAIAAFTTPAFAGEIVKYDLSNFDQIESSAGITVEFVTGPKYSVAAEIIEGVPDRVRVEMDGSRLILSHKFKMGLEKQPRQETIVRVTAPSLNAIRSSSGSTLKASGVKATALAISASSGASLRVDGSCDSLTLSASSGGSANLKDMVCKSVSASASSGGSADATATSSATSKTSSGGSIGIWGNPAARKANKSMSGGSTKFH